MSRVPTPLHPDKRSNPSERLYDALVRAFEACDDGVRMDFLAALAARDAFTALHRGVKKVLDKISTEIDDAR